MASEGSLETLENWVYACIKCGTCKYVFKAYIPSCPSGHFFPLESYFGSGKVLMARGLLEGKYEMTPTMVRKIYTCTTCGSCEVQCEMPVSEHLVEIFEALREEAVKRGVGPLPEHKAFRTNFEERNNPYGDPHDNRLSWIEGEYTPKETAEIVYFVGCTASYRQKNIAKATKDILDKANADYTILSEEICCSSPLLRTGQPGGEKAAKANIEAIKKTGAKIVVTSCAGCYRTMTVDWPRITGGDLSFKVTFISDYLWELIRDKKIEFNEYPIKVTYHDPCHLGRHSNIYDSPRKILQAIPGLELIEMKRNRKNAWCCGAGGGVKSAFKEWSVEVAEERVMEAEETGAEYLTSTCPFCNRNLSDAVTSMGSKLKVVDIVEIVQEKMK